MRADFILRHDPDVVVLATYAGSASPDAARTRPGWDRLAAVKSGRIYAVEGRWLKRGGVSLVAGLEALARCLHPERVGADPLGAPGSARVSWEPGGCLGEQP